MPVIMFGENEVFNIAEAAEGSLLAEMNIGIKAVFGEPCAQSRWEGGGGLTFKPTTKASPFPYFTASA